MAIEAISGASQFLASANWIGTKLDGSTAASPIGIEVSEGNGSAEITGNVLVGATGGTPIVVKGAGAEVNKNQITGGLNAIHTVGGGPFGSTVFANVVKDTSGAGLLIENDLNLVIGNQVSGAGAAGIRIHSAGGQAATENKVGSTNHSQVEKTDDNENLISGSAGPAIEIETLEEAVANQVFRNRGSGNTGLFVALKAISPGTEGPPNGGIEPPVISTASKTGASGTAEPFVAVRVFRKATSATGEIESFLGATVSEADGSWEVDYATAIPAGTSIAANQTPEEDEEGSSELALATTPADPVLTPTCATEPLLCPPSGGSQSSSGGSPPATLPPPAAKPKPLTCRKGFKKKKVGGKTKCVKVKAKKGRR